MAMRSRQGEAKPDTCACWRFTVSVIKPMMAWSCCMDCGYKTVTYSWWVLNSVNTLPKGLMLRWYKRLKVSAACWLNCCHCTGLNFATRSANAACKNSGVHFCCTNWRLQSWAMRAGRLCHWPSCSHNCNCEKVAKLPKRRVHVLMISTNQVAACVCQACIKVFNMLLSGCNKY